jgi:hypothetical protein
MVVGNAKKAKIYLFSAQVAMLSDKLSRALEKTCAISNILAEIFSGHPENWPEITCTASIA